MKAVPRAAMTAVLVTACARSNPPPPEVAPVGCRAGDMLPASPIEYGRAEISCALAAVASRKAAQITTSTSGSRESFEISVGPSGYRIVGGDDVGAMYGALELAERLLDDGEASTLRSLPIKGAPAVPIRAANPFIVMPALGETEWWFLEASFWREYLDLLAHARIDYLDLHAMYDLENTAFPNALLYFASSTSAPDIGIAAEQRARGNAEDHRRDGERTGH
jgi:hypothetical protein